MEILAEDICVEESQQVGVKQTVTALRRTATLFGNCNNRSTQYVCDEASFSSHCAETGRNSTMQHSSEIHCNTLIMPGGR
jgi:hypothetical protein